VQSLQGPTNYLTISGFRPLELKLERGQAAFSLTAFAIKVSNIINYKVLRPTRSGGVERSSAAFLFGSFLFGRGPGSLGCISLALVLVGEDIVNIAVVTNRNHELEECGKAIVRIKSGCHVITPQLVILYLQWHRSDARRCYRDKFLA
jgi:hypothetical protein